MDVPLNTPTEIPVPLDIQAQEVVLLSAQLGSQISDDVFVSYTTLLIGLLFARLDHDKTQLPNPIPVTGTPAWHVEANGALRVDVILSEKSGLSRTVAENSAAAIQSPESVSWPSGRPLLSTSARNVLLQAATVAGEKRGSEAVVTPADIMASYLYTIPPAHERQALNWGLTKDAIDRIGALLPGTESRGRESDQLPGYDPGAEIIIRAAITLAACWRDRKDKLIASETLLVAAVETVPMLAEDDAVEAAVLRNMLHASHPGSPYMARRDATFAMPGVLTPMEGDRGIRWPTQSQNTQLILAAAKTIALRTSSSDIVCARHLIAALICEADGSDRSNVATVWLDDLGVDKDVLRTDVAKAVGTRAFDNRAAWSELLIGGVLSVVTTARPDTIPDNTRHADTLGLLPYADAIAALITAKDQNPPLSIAVFGPWGSGKSFFMAMIREAVKIFAKSGDDAVVAGTNTPFLRRVVPIEFNAWHYAEGNLWASLVHAILVGLQKELSPQESRSVFQEVLNKLLLNEAAQLEAEKKLKDAESQLEASRKALQAAQNVADEKRKDEAKVAKIGDIIEGVWHETLAAIAPAGKEGTINKADETAWVKSVGESVSKAANYLGRPELVAQAEELQRAGNDAAGAAAALKVEFVQIRELLNEAKANANRGMSLVSWLANAGIDRRGAIRLAAITGSALLVLVGIAMLLELAGSKIGAAAATIAAFVLPLLGSLTAAINWARRHLADASRAFAVLGSIRERVEKRQSERLAERDEQVAKAQLLLAEAEAEVSRRKVEVEAVQAAVQKAKEELKTATSPERLKQFIAQRLAEGDYQRHLGLIHTIRSDFERLENILKDVQPGPADAKAGGQGTEKPKAGEAPIQRVVLYIDDLDRCPPVRVVQVLEAVHLLLAFKLFVVVVGVDMRWVSQALRKRYPSQLGDTRGIASPTDYLEKVFQIPFWLPTMDPAAGRRLLEATFDPAIPPSSPVNPAARPPELPPANATGRVDASATPDQRTEQTAGTKPAPDVDTKPPELKVDVQAVAQALTLGETERNRLIEMAAAVGASPRRTIRFANLYRLLKASLSPAERRGFVGAGGKSGSYNGALILLAAGTGAPRATRALIAALSEKPGADVEAYLKGRFEAVAPSVRPSEKVAFAAAKEAALGVTDKASLVRHLHLWAPRVACFVFDEQG